VLIVIQLPAVCYFCLIPSTNEHLLSASLRKARYFVTSGKIIGALRMV
jgi:hypothetical protein